MKNNYTAEFKQSSVDYYLSSGCTIIQASKDLGLAESTLRGWIKDAKSNNNLVNHRGSGNYSTDTEKEIARLKRELKNKDDALEVLKKAISILND